MRFRITGKQAVQTAGCAVFCLIVGIMAFLNRTLIFEPLTDFLLGSGSFTAMTDQVRQNYSGDRVREKNKYISLNGGFASLMGRIRYNGVYRMTNGMLTGVSTSMGDMTAFSDSLIRMNEYLTGKGIPFLFVLTPSKVPAGENILYPWVTDRSNDTADQLVAQLAEGNVPVLDLREEMSQTGMQVEKFFYRTDHHWNVEGAFLAYQRIMEAIRDFFPDTKMSYTDSALWEKTTVPNFWLGSQGRRVGPLFAGTDALDYYLPTFETEMSRYSIGVSSHKGDFRKACMDEELLEVSDYFGMDTYSRYLGGGYPLTLHRNQHAENRRKLYIVRDSFMLQVECFLSTELTSIDVVDPRGYGQMNEMDYIALNQPNMVILMVSPDILVSKDLRHYSGFNVGSDFETVGITRWDDISVLHSAGESDYKVLPAELKSGRSYVLTMEKIQVENGAPEGACVILYDRDEIVDQTVFDIEYGNEFEFRWGFRIPESDEEEHDYQLRFYAGILGDPEDEELDFYGVQLLECILKDA